MQAPIPTSHHTHTHMLATHACFHLIPMFSWPSSGETLICAHSDRLPPRRSSDRGSPAELSLVLCFFRSFSLLDAPPFTSWGTILPGFTSTGRFPLIRVRNLQFGSGSRRGGGGHMQAPIPTSHHTHTHMLGTHASFHLIPMFSWPSSGETLTCAHSDRLPP